MAQQDNAPGPCWESLPSVIMLEIFSYLEKKDRVNASGVCRNWRQALFHPRFWKDILFVLDDDKNIPWSRHLANCFALSVENLTIKCQTPKYSLEFEKLLRSFCENRNLKQLFIEPSSSTFEWTYAELSGTHDDIIDADGNINIPQTFAAPIFQSIIKIIKTSKNLTALTLGCIEELAINSGEIIKLLSHYHGKHLEILGLASVKEEPENYNYPLLNGIDFGKFNYLKILTLDYDYLNDTLLNSLTSGCLERLIIHIHNWKTNFFGTSNLAWDNFKKINKNCELRLNLIHAYKGVLVLHSRILKSSMPLTHLKVLFCEHVNVAALGILSTWYHDKLKSLVWIDSIDRFEARPPTDNSHLSNTPDALVLIAWRCSQLKELIYIGHKYYSENLIAVARLIRGNILKNVEFAESNIVVGNEDEYAYKNVKQEINKTLGNNWKILTNSELAPVLIDAVTGDSRDVIMPLVLNDVK